MSTVNVPLDTQQFIRLIDFLRKKGSEADPIFIIETAIEYWMDNADWKGVDMQGSDFRTDHGYSWKEVFLPQGTKLRMKYKDQFYNASVEGNDIIYEGAKVSPSEFAHRVTRSSRNAWRDIWIKRPNDQNWIFAETLRLNGTKANDTIKNLENEMAELHMKTDITWIDDVYESLISLGRDATLNEIYKEVESLRASMQRTWPISAHAIIRRELENHSSDSDSFLGKRDLFTMPQGKGQGIWALRKKK